MAENRRRDYDVDDSIYLNKLLRQIDETNDPIIRGVLTMMLHGAQLSSQSAKEISEIIPIVNKHNTLITKALTIWNVGLWILSVIQVGVVVAGGFVFTNVMELQAKSSHRDAVELNVRRDIDDLKSQHISFEAANRVAFDNLQNQMNDLMDLKVIKSSK